MGNFIRKNSRILGKFTPILGKFGVRPKSLFGRLAKLGKFIRKIRKKIGSLGKFIGKIWREKNWTARGET